MIHGLFLSVSHGEGGMTEMDLAETDHECP